MDGYIKNTTAQCFIIINNTNLTNPNIVKGHYIIQTSISGNSTFTGSATSKLIGLRLSALNMNLVSSSQNPGNEEKGAKVSKLECIKWKQHIMVHNSNDVNINLFYQVHLIAVITLFTLQILQDKEMIVIRNKIKYH